MQPDAEGCPPTNAEISMIQETTEEIQTKMLKALGDIIEVLVGLRTDMKAMKDMIGTADNAKVAAGIKKQPRIMDREGILTKCLSGLRTNFKKVTFCPSVLPQLLRASSVILKPSKMQLAALKMLIDMMMFSTKGEKSAYETDVGKKTKRFLPRCHTQYR